ncbi:hypothetical protein LguiB_018395 [Lonicera macranthoides]
MTYLENQIPEPPPHLEETWTRTLNPSGLAGFFVLGLVRPRGETEALYKRYDTDQCVVDFCKLSIRDWRMIFMVQSIFTRLSCFRIWKRAPRHLAVSAYGSVRNTVRLLLVLFILAGVAARVLYLVFRPESPDYTIDNLEIQGINLTSSSPILPRIDGTVRALFLGSPLNTICKIVHLDQCTSRDFKIYVSDVIRSSSTFYSTVVVRGIPNDDRHMMNHKDRAWKFKRNSIEFHMIDARSLNDDHAFHRVPKD